MKVNPQSLQHVAHNNILGIGACTNIHKYGTFNSLLGILYQSDVVSYNTNKFLFGKDGSLAL